jgi:hypothetical protein
METRLAITDAFKTVLEDPEIRLSDIPRALIDIRSARFIEVKNRAIWNTKDSSHQGLEI